MEKSKMTKEEFKTHINVLLQRYDAYKYANQHERAITEQLQEHDPELANLINKHMDTAANVYEYVFKKVESAK